MYHVSLAVQCIYGWSDEGGEDGDRNERSEIHGGEEKLDITCPLVCRYLVLCDESEEDLRVMVGRFSEVCRRRLKVNADRSEVMVLNGEEGLV